MRQDKKDKPDRPKADGPGVILARVSNPKQELKSQLANCERQLQEWGLTVIETLVDTQPRDMPDHRPNFQRLLRMVEREEIAWCLIDHIDRLGVQDAYHLGSILHLFRCHGVELWSIAQGELTNSDEVGVLLNTLNAIKSTKEQLDDAWRIIRDKRSRVENNFWVGGTPAYGYAVAAVDSTGKEVWRVEYLAPNHRQKVYPDGRREDFIGKKNMPKRDKGVLPRLVPSLDEQRLGIVRKIFEWWVHESISQRQIAMRLLALKIPPVSGKWNGPRIGVILRCETYRTGLVSWNRRGQGRHLELRDGKVQAVPKEKNKAKTGRKRADSDVVRPLNAVGDGVIPPDLWDAAQAKLAVLAATPSGGPKAPKNASLYFASLVYCAHCGQRMSGWFQKRDGKKSQRSYVCQTHKTKGPESGCQLHRIHHETLERLVEQYLDETGQGLAAVLDPRLTPPYWEEPGEPDELLTPKLAYMKAINEVWRAVRSAGKEPPEGEAWTVSSLDAACRATDRDDTGKQLAEKEAELEMLVKRFSLLTSKLAIEAANRQLEALETEIVALRERAVQPPEQRLQQLRDELRVLMDNGEAARQAMVSAAPRQRAAALQKVIAKITCRFRHQPNGRGQVNSILTEVRIEPLLGDVRVFPSESLQ
jgi:predicted site-specific integrase-resolvase